VAVFRMVYTDIWNDPDFEGWSVDEKLLFFFFLTNPKSSQCGITEITVNKISAMMNMGQVEIMALLTRFDKKYKKARYSPETHELAIKNWFKWNTSRSPKLLSHVIKEFHAVKNRKLIKYLTHIDDILEMEAMKGVVEVSDHRSIPDQLSNIDGFEPCWDKWLEYRKKVKKKAVSDIAASGQFNKLIKILADTGESPIEVMERAIDKGWEGLFGKEKTGKRRHKQADKEFIQTESKIY